MGIAVFFVLLAQEAFLAVRRIQTNDWQRGMTALLRGLSVLALATLFAFSVATWGFRYYALAAVLLVSAAASIARLFQKGGAAATRPRFLLRAALMAAFLFVASLPAMLFPEYRPLPVTGGYPVQTSVRYFTDESRVETYDGQGEARTLAVEFWYPAHTDGKFPLVVYSHGALGTRTGNETLFLELASHGYVVCSIDHTGQCLYTTRENGEAVSIDNGYIRELRNENAKVDKQNSLMLYRKWMGVRVADIDFVIDTVVSQAKAPPSDALYGLIDAQKIGVFGHSLGGAAALGAGRSRNDIGAVIALEAPFLCDILDVENGSFVFESADYPVPVLNIYSDSAWPHLNEWPQYAFNAYLLSGADEDAYSLHLAGTGHLSLTDLSLASPLLTRISNGHTSPVGAKECLTQLNERCLAFFDWYL